MTEEQKESFLSSITFIITWIPAVYKDPHIPLFLGKKVICQ